MFELFDRLCLLCDGRCVFFGPADRALAHYEAAGLPCPPLRNPADHFLHAINPDFQVGGRVGSGRAAVAGCRAACERGLSALVDGAAHACHKAT